MDQKTSYKTLLIAFLIWFVISIIIVSITGFIYYSAINQVSCYEELTEEERELISKDLFDLHRLPKKWRADAGQYYAYIEFDNGILTTLMSPDNRYEIDNNLYASNNYYPLDLDLTDKIERINNILNE